MPVAGRAWGEGEFPDRQEVSPESTAGQPAPCLCAALSSRAGSSSRTGEGRRPAGLQLHVSESSCGQLCSCITPAGAISRVPFGSCVTSPQALARPTSWRGYGCAGRSGVQSSSDLAPRCRACGRAVPPSLRGSLFSLLFFLSTPNKHVVAKWRWFLSPVPLTLQCLVSAVYARTPYRRVSPLHAPSLPGGASPASPGTARTVGVRIFPTI